MPIVEGIATGIVSNYIFSVLTNKSRQRFKKFIPGFFSSGSEPFITAADEACEEAVQEIFDRYGQYPVVKRIFDVSNIESNLPIKMIFDHVFQGETPFSNKKLDDAIKDFQNPDDKPYLSDVRQLADEIRNSIINALTMSPKTAPFVLKNCIYEIRQDLQAGLRELKSDLVNNSSELENKVDEFTKYYVSTLKSNIKNILIHGLDSITRKERMKHELISAFVPIYVSSKSIFFKKNNWRGDAIEAFDEVKKITIRGSAGSGKTTFLHWLVMQSNADNTDLLTTNYIPIFIPLRRISKMQRQNRNIDDILIEAMPSSNLKNHMPLGWLQSLYSNATKIVFMFDGIDEVRTHNRDYIWSLIEETNNTFPQSKVIVTSRNISSIHLSDGSYRPDIYENEQSYSEMRKQWRPPRGFMEFTVAPLTNSEIIEFIEKWFNGVDPEVLPPSERADVAHYPERLKSDLFGAANDHVLDLSRTPLLCALICMVFFLRKGRLPTSKGHLYEIATKLLVETRDEQRGVDSEPKFAKFDLDNRLKLLKHIALLMQEGAVEGHSDQSIEVAKESIIKWIKSYFQEEVTNWDFSNNEILNFLIERCTIIREPAVNKIDFVHRSFMEFLAADQIAKKRDPHSIRNNLKKDEWTNTLQFCMDTHAGGPAYGGALISEIYNAIKQTPGAGKRTLYFKLLSLLKHTDEMPFMYHGVIKDIVEEILPIKSNSEVEDLFGVPPSILHELISLDKIQKFDDEYITNFAILLAKHPSIETKRTLLSGYENLAHRDVIKIINSTGKLSVDEHFALRKRIINGSYKDIVVLRTSELANRDIRKNSVKSVSLVFPPNSNSFVGWDILRYSSNLTLHNLTMNDIQFMLDSAKKVRFDSCQVVKLLYPNRITCEGLVELFPNIKELEFIRPMGLSLLGLGKAKNIRDVWVIGCNEKVQVSKNNIPNNLQNLIFSSSTPPTVEEGVDKSIVTCEEHGINDSLYIPKII